MIRFHVPTMAFGGCVRGVTAAIRAVAPGARVAADLQAREVTVTAADGSGPDTLLGALRRAGYEAEARPVA